MTPNEGEHLNQTPIPRDDPKRSLVVARADDANRPHIGLVGDTYTVLLSGKDTAGRFCLIDMHIPPGGGPPPHRHDFEESFVLLEGEMEATFRSVKSLVKAGETVHIPANAPHQFHNAGTMPVRLLCICSPAGQEEFFAEGGFQLRRERRRLQNSIRVNRRSSWRRRLRWRGSIALNSWSVRRALFR